MHLDLATGRSVLVPLDIEPEKQRDTLPLMLQSHRAGLPVTWAAGMTLFVDLTLSGHGVATVMLSAAYDSTFVGLVEDLSLLVRS
jgi:hypothetical protein